MSDENVWQEWTVLELMGHRRLAGLVTEQQIAGKGFLRLDVPGDGDTWTATQLYNPDSVYCMTPTSEENARKIAALSQPRPATRWELEAVPAESKPGWADDDYEPGDDD